MTNEQIIQYRLINQQIAGCSFTTPEEIVSWMAAMQAQEYAMSKWSIGLRLKNTTDSMIEDAFNKGHLIRTHLLRPTWHFVAPADIRWMLKLTAPRVHAINAFMYRKCELDKKILIRTAGILEKQLSDGQFKTRTALNKSLQNKKILADGIRLSLICMYAELEGIICSGPRQGKQFTYALLEERVPASQKLSRNEALAKLTRRYFKSRGPATIKDYATWSGLTMKDCRQGIEMMKGLEQETINDQTIYFYPQPLPDMKKLQTTFLMPDYDEYGIGYCDRSAILPPKTVVENSRKKNPVYNRMIILNGVIAGTWQRTFKNNQLIVETYPFTKLNSTNQIAIRRAVRNFELFHK